MSDWKGVSQLNLDSGIFLSSFSYTRCFIFSLLVVFPSVLLKGVWGGQWLLGAVFPLCPRPPCFFPLVFWPTFMAIRGRHLLRFLRFLIIFHDRQRVQIKILTKWFLLWKKCKFIPTLFLVWFGFVVFSSQNTSTIYT